jgi:tetratricopeptide (TPR) repeat protein
VNALSETYRVPFKLHLEERSQVEIARLLGISVASANKRVQRARSLLRSRLGEWAVPEGPATGGPRMPPTALVGVERAIADIVSDYRVVDIRLEGGGEVQICLRAKPEVPGRAAQARVHAPRPPRDAPDWFAWLDAADMSYRAGMWAEARDAYRRILGAAPACVPAALRLGEILTHEGRAEDAAQVYGAALAACTDDAGSARLRAESLAAQGRHRAAAAAFRSAIALSPDEPELYYGLDRALARRSRYEEQLENLAALRRIVPGDVRAFDAAYTPCARLHRFDIALPLLERAVAVDPHYPPAVRHLFQVRGNLGLLDTATMSLAERLVRLTPELLDGWRELAWAYREAGRAAEAVALLRRFLQDHPLNAEALAAVAWCYHNIDDAEAAAQALKAYELQPRSWYVAWTVAMACASAREAVGAQKAGGLLAEIRADWCSDAFIQEQLSCAYMAFGQGADALRTARRSTRLAPGASLAHIQYSRALLQFGPAEEALRVTVRLLSSPLHRTPLVLCQHAVVLAHTSPRQMLPALEEAAARARWPRECLFVARHADALGARSLAGRVRRKAARLSPAPVYLPEAPA